MAAQATSAIGSLSALSGAAAKLPTSFGKPTGFQNVLQTRLNAPAVPAGMQLQAAGGNAADLMLLHSLTQAAQLVGKTALYEKPGSATPARGKVEGVRVENGKLFLLIAGKNVALSQVRGIDATP